MDFFRSILSDDPDPETPNSYQQSDSDPPQIRSPNHQNAENDEDDDSTSNLNSSDDGSGGAGSTGMWSFGDLVKTLTTKSESVFETYRRDLKEFGTGLRKESDLFREVASRAVKELPASIEVGTSAIDGVLKSIAQGKEAIFISSDVDESDASDRFNSSDRSGLESMRYSRFDAQLNAIRSDVRVYCEDPEDVEDYRKWKLGFVVGDKRGEIEELVGENGAMHGIYCKVVPNEVDDATFWFRYFYKVYKLRQQEEMRAKLVKRSLSIDDDEDLSWEVDDDDDNEEEQLHHRQQQEADWLTSSNLKGEDSDNGRKKESPNDEIRAQSSKIVDEDKEMTSNVVSVDKKNVEKTKAVEKGESVSNHDEMTTNVVSVDKNNVEELKAVEKAESVSKHDETTTNVVSVDKDNVEEPIAVEKAESVSKHDEKVDVKVEPAGIEDSNVTSKSDQQSRPDTHSFQEDEDLEWDEIEDLGKADDKNVVSHGDITNKADLRKRLSTAVDEDEDLSWDIEDDDDEPVKPAGNK